MYNEFLITEAGLQLNGKVLMPGTRLLHKGEAPTSWKNVGHATGAAVERKLVVASPLAIPEQTTTTAKRGKPAKDKR